MDVKVCLHQKRYGVEIMVESQFREKSISWVEIDNESGKRNIRTISLGYVEHRVTRKPVSKAKPQPKPTVRLSPISILCRERNSIDINPSRLFYSVKSHDQIVAT